MTHQTRLPLLRFLVLGAALPCLLVACGKSPAPSQSASQEGNTSSHTQPAAEVTMEPSADDPMARIALFGAVHVHTNLSFDAFTNGTVTSPADAYRWARGEVIQGNKAGAQFKIRSPLDFYAVSDHAEMMGTFVEMTDPESEISKNPMTERVLSEDQNTAMQAFAEILREMSTGNLDSAFTDPAISSRAWSRMVETADAYYEPGTFTTFPAFEWSSNPNTRNLHRVVLFRDTKHVPELPFSALDSWRPEDLWAWMGVQRAAGSTLLAIPHNGNASDGMMFSTNDSRGEPLDAAYIAERSLNEPLYEISQIKGTSETHPDLSPNDEFAGFELWDYTLSADFQRPTNRKGSYARQALLDGLSFADSGQGNPFQFGFIGDTDTHNAAASNEEANYTGKFAFEADPNHRLHGLEGQPEGQKQQVREFSSGGLAGVWASDNTREAIFDAMQRRETFATSGAKIQVRMFGGFGLTATVDDDWLSVGYAHGVPMGGVLESAPEGSVPSFVLWAMRAPDSGNLDRLQVVKGWVDADGQQHEAIFDVAWSDDRAPGEDGKLPPVGNTVDAATATFQNTIGSVELFANWTDPDFDPAQHAFYYLRAIAIPTPRWSTYDAAALGVPLPKGLPVSIQERAWGSPIWYTP